MNYLTKSISMKKIEEIVKIKQFKFLFYFRSILFFSVFSVLFSFYSMAQGNLLITPQRIVLEGNKQRDEITLVNSGQDTAYYSISFLQYNMTDDGSFEEVTEPLTGQKFADSYVRFFPRSVELAPGESQVVRLQLRRTPNMENGEYRSHLYFRAVPKEKPLGEEETVSDNNTIGIKLTPIFGISIPVIVRVGDIASSVVLSDVFVHKGENQQMPELTLVINREGEQSVYGDLNVEYISPGGKHFVVGTVRGIAVYTPNSLRRFSMPLNVPEEVDFSRGKLLVRYGSSSETKAKIFDETELDLK